MQHTIHAITSAAGRQDDLSREWNLKVGNHDATQLEEPGEGWISLDREVAAALTKIAHGEIGRHNTQATTTALSNHAVARGGVLLAFVFRYYASGNNAQVLYDLNHRHGCVLKRRPPRIISQHMEYGFERAQ